MADVDGEIVINRPVEAVYDFVADERNGPLYDPNPLRSELTSGEPIGPGSQFHVVMSMRGRPVAMDITYTGDRRPHVLVSASHLSNMEIRGALMFDPVPQGTRMRWSWELQPGWFIKVLQRLVALMGRRQERERSGLGSSGTGKRARSL